MGKVKDLFGHYPNLREIAAELNDLLYERDRLADQVDELREYKKKYSDLLDSSISHGRAMMGGLLAVAMTPGVLPAIAKANESSASKEA